MVTPQANKSDQHIVGSNLQNGKVGVGEGVHLQNMATNEITWYII